MTAAATKLDLTTLGEQCRLSSGMRAVLVEAAGVVLAHHRHANPCEGQWGHDDTPEQAIHLVWAQPDPTIVQTHNNLKDATEDGAYAVAIAAASALGYEVCGRTEQGSGADFWMTKRGGDPTDVYHLEVSGISERGAPGHRLAKKRDQGQGGPLRNPGVAVVFRFKDAALGSKSWR